MAWGLTEFGLAEAERTVSPVLALTIGALVFVLFVGWESRVAVPMVKLGLFASRAFSGANLYTLFLFFALGAVLFFLPMTVVSAWGAPEWQASLMMLPLSLSIALFSGRAGRFADRRGPRLLLTLGAGLVGLSYAGLAATMPLMR